MTGLARWTRVLGLSLAVGLLAALAFLAYEAIRRDAALGQPLQVDPSIFVGDQSDWLLDFGDISTVDATTWPDIETRFTPSSGKMPGVGLRYYQGGRLWLKFNVPELSGDQDRWTIRLANYRVLDARLIVLRDGSFVERNWSYDSPERRAALERRTPTFEFDRAEIEGATIVMGFSSRGAMRGNVYVETARATDSFEFLQASIYSALLGIMWALAVYLLVIGTRLGERSLVFAAGMSFTLGLFVYGVGGYVHAVLLWPWPVLADVVLYGLQPWPATFWVLLAVSYLRLNQTAPRTALVLTVIAMLLPLQGVLTLFTSLGYPIPFITDNATPVMIGMVAGLAPVIWLSIRGNRRAQGLLLAFAPVGIGSFIRVINYLTPSPDPFWVATFDLFADMVLTVILLAAVIVIDLQRREAALRREANRKEQRFRSFAEIASDSYFETDASGRVVSAAGRLPRDLGLTEGSDLETALSTSLGAAAEGSIGAFRQALGTGTRLSDLEVGLHGASGSVTWLSFNLAPFDRGDGEGAGLRGTITDVTDRVSRREREGRQNTLSALGQLASGVAHEVNNLLHPMVNLAQRVRDKHTEDPEARQLLDLVVASGKHAGEIVAGVLNAFNPVRMPGERLPISVALGRALDTVQPTLPATISLRRDVMDSAGVDVPPGEMLQVISNLLSNAIRAMEGIGEVTVSLGEVDGDLLLRFVDNGPGMPEEIRRHATEPFVTGRPQGTGLGLAVVANIVRGWGGAIEIASRPGAGTTIGIRIAPRTVDNIQ